MALCRGAAGSAPPLAAELVQLKVDVIVTAGSTPATLAVKRATATIPVVMVAVGAPLDTGLVSNLARPGGNLTGFTTLGGEVASKRLEFVKDLLPGAFQLALSGILTTRRTRGSTATRAISAAGAPEAALGRSADANDFDSGFALLTKQRPDALLLTADPTLLVHMGRVIEFTTKHRVPTIYNTKDSVMAGGLMSYDADQPELYRRAATYVDKILKGARPGDLPVEQPTKFELVINLKTAKALGLTIKPSLLLQADQIIEWNAPLTDAARRPGHGRRLGLSDRAFRDGVGGHSASERPPAGRERDAIAGHPRIREGLLRPLTDSVPLSI